MRREPAAASDPLDFALLLPYMLSEFSLEYPEIIFEGMKNMSSAFSHTLVSLAFFEEIFLLKITRIFSPC